MAEYGLTKEKVNERLVNLDNLQKFYREPLHWLFSIESLEDTGTMVSVSLRLVQNVGIHARIIDRSYFEVSASVFMKKDYRSKEVEAFLETIEEQSNQIEYRQLAIKTFTAMMK